MTPDAVGSSPSGGPVHFVRHSAMPPGLVEKMEQLAFEHGRSYDSYLAIEPDRESLWDPQFRGAISFARWWRHAHVVGGLLAPVDIQGELLDASLAFFREARLTPSFYNVGEHDAALFRERGFQLTRWGVDAIVELADRTWAGADFAWLRRQANYCERHGLVAQEVRPALLPAAEWRALVAELTEVSDAWLAQRPQRREMRVLDGRFLPDALFRRRIFVARADRGRGRVEAMLVLSPMLGGQRWATELYRHRPDSVRGAVPFLKLRTLQTLQREGVVEVSLCIAPGIGIDSPRSGESGLLRAYLRLGRRFGSFAFDMQGLFHFRSRFRPRFEERYIATHPKATFGSVWSFTRVVGNGFVDLDPRRAARAAWTDFRKRRQRATMTDPKDLDTV